MAKNGKNSDKKGKRARRKGDKQNKRSQVAPSLAPARDLPRSAPAALAVAAGALVVAAITGLWRVRR